MEKNYSDSPRLWQKKFLIITGIIEIAIELVCLTFVIVLGYHGYAAGEMGTMVGIFSTAVFILLLPFAGLRTAAVFGLRSERRWAAVITIILSAVILLAGFFTVRASAFIFVFILLYAALSMWAAITCLRCPGFGSGR